MTHHPLATTIRGKKLGVLLRDARLARGKSLEECAIAVGVTAEMLEQFEFGVSNPPLPVVELLAFFLNVPIDQFWGSASLAANEPPARHPDPEKLSALRQKMIAVMLRKTRTEANIPLAQLAEETSIPLEKLQNYESGSQPIPLPELEILAQALNAGIRVFEDQRGPVGAWIQQQRMGKSFAELPAELQAFVCKPVNRPYIELAQRLSEMSVEKLRAVAEGLLEITL